MKRGLKASTTAPKRISPQYYLDEKRIESSVGPMIIISWFGKLDEKRIESDRLTGCAYSDSNRLDEKRIESHKPSLCSLIVSRPLDEKRIESCLTCQVANIEA